MPASATAKHRKIYEQIHRAILNGEYAVGDRIPTEMELGESHNCSRPTISRALRELEQQGYLVRRRGLGTFVRDFRQAPSGLLGLTIPQTEAGIAAPILNEIVHRSEIEGYGVLFGGRTPRDALMTSEAIEAFCTQFISRRVAGVFFLPLIPPEGYDHVNREIAEVLTQAGITVVLLDRDIVDYPARSQYDLVGVDNRRNAFVATQHLLNLGCRRIEFINLVRPVSTGTARAMGYRDALRAAGIEPRPEWIHQWDPADNLPFVRELLEKSQAEAFVCINDDIARALLHHLATVGVKVPEDIRVMGLDDLPFAGALPVPLSSMRQPTKPMGLAAVETMLSRLQNPELPARDIMLACELQVRASCGAARPVKAAQQRSA